MRFFFAVSSCIQYAYKVVFARDGARAEHFVHAVGYNVTVGCAVHSLVKISYVLRDVMNGIASLVHFVKNRVSRAVKQLAFRQNTCVEMFSASR